MSETEVAEDSARRLAEEHGLRFVDLTQSALAPARRTSSPKPSLAATTWSPSGAASGRRSSP